MTARSDLVEAALQGTGTKGIKRFWQKAFGVEQHDVEQVLDAMTRNRVLTLDWLGEEGFLPPMPEQPEGCECIALIHVTWEASHSLTCRAPVHLQTPAKA